MNIPLLAGIAISFFGIYLFVHALKNKKIAAASMNWKKVSGKINRVDLWGKRNIDGEMKDADRLSVEYEYSVHDTLHTGTSVAFYTLMYPETTQFAESYPAGSAVEVYYDPSAPSESVLIPGNRKGNKRFSDLILAVLSILIGSAVAIAGWMGYLG